MGIKRDSVEKKNKQVKMISKCLLILATLTTSTGAFTPLTKDVRTSTSLSAMSKSVPFLTSPKGLKGYVGDVGFDPLAFSDFFDIKWLREAEIKHGRASMLACLGFVTTQYVSLPGVVHVADSNMAPIAVGAGPMLQIVFWVGLLEIWTNKGNITMLTMFEEEDRVPGELGFDPLGLSVGKTQEQKDEMALKEIKNGRLAMLAIGGMIHHNWITGDPLL